MEGAAHSALPRLRPRVKIGYVYTLCQAHAALVRTTERGLTIGEQSEKRLTIRGNPRAI